MVETKDQIRNIEIEEITDFDRYNKVKKEREDKERKKCQSNAQAS
jgi:hypothetical protein